MIGDQWMIDERWWLPFIGIESAINRGENVSLGRWIVCWWTIFRLQGSDSCDSMSDGKADENGNGPQNGQKNGWFVRDQLHCTSGQWWMDEWMNGWMDRGLELQLAMIGTHFDLSCRYVNHNVRNTSKNGLQRHRKWAKLRLRLSIVSSTTLGWIDFPHSHLEICSQDVVDGWWINTNCCSNDSISGVFLTHVSFPKNPKILN